MNMLITGICGFVGTTLALELRKRKEASEINIIGIDNLSRRGSEINCPVLKRSAVRFVHGDLRLRSDLEPIGDVDWVIDAAANPSVLAGVDGCTSSRQLVEHNLQGTVNLLEFCKARHAGLMLLSTSRVYSVAALTNMPVEVVSDAFRPIESAAKSPGLSQRGISEAFPTTAPVSLYGATKLASEQLALEYGASFGFPVWINRCGVLAGAGQFGRSDQGIFSFWINSWIRNRPLKYIGFNGHGHQVRDCLHPRDIVPLLLTQMSEGRRNIDPIINLGGGISNSLSLAQLSAWCRARFGPREVTADSAPRPFDAPWVVMDCSRADELWKWRMETPVSAILDEMAAHAQANPHWLELSG
jgi:CDP-paratose 2-epimerase